MSVYNPIAIRRSRKVRVRDEAAVRDSVIEGWKKIRGARSAWETRILKNRARRYCDKSKTNANWPWRGSAQIHLPLIDSMIAKQVPLFARLIFKAEPPINFIPMGHNDYESAAKAEMFMDSYVKVRLNRKGRLRQQLLRHIDTLLQDGLSFLKTSWDYATQHATEIIPTEEVLGVPMAAIPDIESAQLKLLVAQRLDINPEVDGEGELLNDIFEQVRALNEEVRYEREYETTNEARIEFVHPYDIYLPADTYDLQDSPLIIQRIRIPRWKLRIRGKNNTYMQSRTTTVLDEAETELRRIRQDASQPTTMFEDEIYARAGIDPSSAPERSIELLECYFYHDIDGDGNLEKCVMTLHEHSNTVLRFIEYPYRHGEWPFTDFRLEEADGLVYSSRGIADQNVLGDLQTEMTALHRAKLDNMTLTNAPIFKAGFGSGIPETVELWPGKVVFMRDPVNGMVPLTQVNSDISFEREELILRAWAEQRVGSPDFAITDPDRRGERRTATEVAAITDVTEGMFDGRAHAFQDRMQQVWYQVWALWLQYGDEQEYISAAGDRNTQVQTVTKEQMQKNFEIIPAGTPYNTANRLKQQQLVEIANVVLSNPLTGESINPHEFVKTLIRFIDPKLVEPIVQDPQSRIADQQADEANEILQMLLGVPVMPKEGEAHVERLQVLRNFLTQPNQFRDQADPQAIQLILQHEEMTRQLAEKATGEKIPPLAEMLGIGGQREGAAA